MAKNDEYRDLQTREGQGRTSVAAVIFLIRTRTLAVFPVTAVGPVDGIDRIPEASDGAGVDLEDVGKGILVQVSRHMYRYSGTQDDLLQNSRQQGHKLWRRRTCDTEG